jgi:hypothetical protein
VRRHERLKPCSMSINTQAKVSSDMATPVRDLTIYLRLAKAFHYLTFNRLDISYAVQQACLYMHDPREPHLMAVKGILHYLQVTLDHCLLFCCVSLSELVVYTDVDCVGCLDTCRCTMGDPLWATLCFWATTSSPGPRSARMSSPV